MNFLPSSLSFGSGLPSAKLALLAIASSAVPITGFGAPFILSFDFYGNPNSGNPVNFLYDTADVTPAERAAGKADLNSVLVNADSVNPPAVGGTPIGQLWRDYGINISITAGTSLPLGLFDSHDNFTTTGSVTGDNDLLTGTDVNTNPGGTRKENSLFGAQPMGNLLIVEENPGDGVPDDANVNPTIRFDIDNTGSFAENKTGSVEARLDYFVFVDDVNVKVQLFFTDGSDRFILGTATSFYSVPNDNQVLSLHGIGDPNPKPLADVIETADLSNPPGFSLDYFTVQFQGSGGIGEVGFEFLSSVPEFSSTTVGCLFFTFFIAFRSLRRPNLDRVSV